MTQITCLMHSIFAIVNVPTGMPLRISVSLIWPFEYTHNALIKFVITMLVDAICVLLNERPQSSIEVHGCVSMVEPSKRKFDSIKRTDH